MTGRQWSRMGIPGVFSPTTNSGLPLNETTLAEQLHLAGYATAAVGKWHLGQRSAYLPASRGFDEYLGIPYSDDMGEARATRCGRTAPISGMAQMPGRVRPAVGSTSGDGTTPVESALEQYIDAELAQPLSEAEKRDPAGAFLPLVKQNRTTRGVVTQVLEQPTDLTTLSDKYRQFALDFIDQHASSPFFLYLPFSHVHTTMPNQPEEQFCSCEHKNATRRGAFGDALADVDALVRDVAERLRHHGIDRNTLILFTGDNGPWMVKGTSGGSEGIFSGRFSGYWNVGKGSTWEGGIREAGFAHWPGVVKPFTRSAEIVSSMDVFPTVLKLAGRPLPDDRTYDGRDFSRIMLDDAGRSEHKVLFFYGGARPAPAPAAAKGSLRPSAARYGPFKAHFATGPGLAGCSPSPAAPAGCPTLVYSAGPLLFNVEVDPSEAHPLSANTTQPADPTLAAVIATIMAAYDAEVATLHSYHEKPPPDAPGEGPGEWGVCCNRTLGCDCNGPPRMAAAGADATASLT